MSHGGRSEQVAFLREAIAKIEAGQMPGPASRDMGAARAACAPLSGRESPSPSWQGLSRSLDSQACLRRVDGPDKPGHGVEGLPGSGQPSRPCAHALPDRHRPGTPAVVGTFAWMAATSQAASLAAASKIRLGGAEAETSLDAALGGGLDRNGVHEIVASTPADAWAACGFALALAARFAAAAAGADGALLWAIEDFSAHETGAPYGPGLAAHGLDPDRLVLVHAVKPQDALWVMEEALRAKALAAVVGEIWSVKDYGLAASRRLLLAARASHTPCLLIQAGAAGKAALLSSAADTRFDVAARRSIWEAAADGLPLPGHPAWSVRLAKAKGSLGFDRERSFHLVWDPAERCLRDEPVSTLPLSVHRPALSGDRARPAPHAGRRQAAGA